MDSTFTPVSLEQIVDAVVENLTRSGQLANLGQASLDTIEGEVLQNIDKVTCGVISELLRKQAKLTETPQGCPKCGGPLCEKPSQGRSMQSRRGTVHFKCDVFRCEVCRLDFFPSVPCSRL
jgi:uncharacterized protein with PIN domain